MLISMCWYVCVVCKKVVKSIPQNRLATPEEVAKIVVFLSSDNNSYLTGQNIIVDGGFTVVWFYG